MNAIGFHPEAAEELEASVIWYSNRSPVAARRFVEEVEHALQEIVRAPTLWPRYDQARRFVLRRYPYSVIYQERSGLIEVLAVAHAKRRPGYWKHRA